MPSFSSSTSDPRDDPPHVIFVELTDALASIAPRGVDVGVRRISITDVELLTLAEGSLTAEMAEERRAEFATGRVLLRDLLSTAGPILRSDSRAPILPVGAVGSLAHDRHHAVAAVTWQLGTRAIGVDLEPVGPGPLTSDEAAIIVRDDDVVPDPLAAFVMKEAAYKAWSTLGGPVLGHHDVRVEHQGQTFTAAVLVEQRPTIRTTFSGALARTPHHWLALVVVESP